MGPELRTTVPSSIDATYSAAVDALPHHCGNVGRYLLLTVIGQGGMGMVWEAYDPVLDRKIALKLMLTAATRGNVVAEAQAMARLQHAHVVTVHDAGIQQAGDAELAYVAMELVAGRTLKQWLEDPQHTLDERLDRFVLAGRGLEAAHAAGLVHRDFKPSNVLLGDDGRVRVSDFGLAQLHPAPGASGDLGVSVDSNASTGSPRAGTPRYMAPEQLHGRPADARADQFAYCVALYEAVFGGHPFVEGEEHPGQPVRTRRAAPAAGSRLLQRLLPLLERGLAVEPQARWGSMGELLAAIEAVRPRRGRRLLLATAAVALLGLAGVALLGWRSAVSSPPQVCGHAADALASTWDGARRQKLAGAFAPLEKGREAAVWPRVATTLDDYAARWRTLRVEQCEADRNGARPSPPLTARRECLERRLGELDGLLRVFEQPDSTVLAYALGAAHALRAPESCLGALPPLDARAATPPVGAAVTEVRARIDRARALRTVGKEQPALAEAKAAAAVADAIAWAPLTAEAHLELGNAEEAIADGKTYGTDAYYRALTSAEAARDDRLRFWAAMGLFSASLDASEVVQAARWHELSRAIATHLPASNLLVLYLLLDDERLAMFEGKNKDCVKIGQDALPLAERDMPGSSVHVMLMRNKALCHRELGENQAAYDLLVRALAMSEQLNGHDAPQPANIMTDLGATERVLGRHDAALAHYQDALAIRAGIVGPMNPDCGVVHNNIGNVLRDLGRYDEARTHLERAIAIFTAAWGPDHAAVGNSLNILGRVTLAQGRPGEAEPFFRRALEIRRKKLPAKHDKITDTLEYLGTALLGQKKREALAVLEEALARREQNPDSSAADKADLRFWVARSRLELGIRPEGALALATEACLALDAPDWQEELAACRSWLDAHGGRSRP